MMPKSHILLFLAAVLMCRFGVNAQINTEQSLRVGQNALYFEDYVLSIQYFNQAIQAKPYLAQPYLLRAIAKLNLDDYKGAETDASLALDRNPFLTDAWEVRGVARQNMGSDSAAISDYREALSLLPRNRQILFNMAMAQTNAKQYDAADSTYTDLLRFYPGFDNGYLGRARLRLVQADTTAAAADIDKALSINKNALNAYIMRADIAINRAKDYEAAPAAMDQAIKLERKLTGLYINRAFLRYNLDDYFGAMADFDYALALEPLNSAALFNRALLLQEVGDNDRALADYSRLIEIEPDNYRALYNRAVVRGEKHEFKEAIADINRVIEAYPDFASAQFLRSDLRRQMGETSLAKSDYDRAMTLMRDAAPASESASTDAHADAPTDNRDLDPATAASRFNTLLTVDDNADIAQEYNNSAIRGRVQDRHITVDIEPLMELTFYTTTGELGSGCYYVKEVDDVNQSRALRMAINVTSRPAQIDDPGIFQRHFNSIDYYNSYLSTHAPRAIDYVGRALDLITVKNYPAAIADLDRAVAAAPDSPLPLMLRAQARYRQAPEEDSPREYAMVKLQQVQDDYTRAADLAPLDAPIWYNKGNIHFEQGDYTSAIAAYTRAIELKPDMGEAFYNRGYVLLKMGNQRAGIADLSKAGELGIVSAYSLIKRVQQ